MSRRSYYSLALLVLLVAAGLRIGRLAELPPGPHYDEAANLLIARSVAFNGADIFPIVNAYQGREALYYYLSVPLLRWVSDSRFSLQVLNVFASLVTIAATMALGRVMFRGARGRLIGLVAGALMTLSFPLLLLARQAFRAPMLPLMQALALLCLWRGLRTRRAVWLVIGGLCAGLALYTYNSSRLFPVWLLLGLLPLLWERGRLREGLLFFAPLALTAAPMGVFAVQHPDIFLNRLYEVTQPEQSITLLESIRLHLWMFFVQGDPLLRYNLPGRPYFTWPEGLLLLVGLGVGLRGWWRGPALKRAAYSLLLLAPLMILPSVVSVGGFPPNHMRAIAMVPLVFILLGVGAAAVVAFVRQIVGTRRAVSLRGDGGFIVLAALVFLFVALLVGRLYFEWAGRADLFYQTDADLAAAVRWIPDHMAGEDRLYIAAVDRRHPGLAIADLPDYYPLGSDSLWLPPPGETALLVIPRSVLVSEDWDQWLAPYHLGNLPAAPDGRSAFLAYALPADLTPLFAVPPLEATHNGVVQLLGYRAYPIFAGAEGDIELHWRVLNVPDMPDLIPLIQVEDRLGTVLARDEVPLVDTDRWQLGEIMYLRFRVRIPPGTAPGQVVIRATWVGRSSNHYLNFIAADGGQRGIWADAGEVEVLRPASFPDPADVPIAHRQTVDLAPGLRLLGSSALPDSLRPGETLALTLDWQALDTTRGDDTVQALLIKDGQEIPLGDPLAAYPPSTWVEGEIAALPVRWTLPLELPGGDYTLMLRSDSAQADLGSFTVADLARQMTPPDGVEALDIRLGDALALYGYTMELGSGTLDLRLVWQAHDFVTTDYTVFVHVLDRSGAIVQQQDVMPVENSYPTSLWIAGEYVMDTHHFADLAPGEYQVRLGLYNQATGARLPRADGSGDLIDLGTVRIP